MKSEIVSLHSVRKIRWITCVGDNILCYGSFSGVRVTDLYKQCSGIWNVFLSDGTFTFEDILSHLIEGELKGYWVSGPYLIVSNITTK
jgi:hypothetical protein